MRVELGDWVSGRTKDGELLHGYVASIDTYEGTVAIQVVDSDREEAIGRAISVPTGAVHKLPEEAAVREEDLLALIDLALMTRDEAWFAELTGDLLKLRRRSGRQQRRMNSSVSARNRLGTGFA